MNKKKEKTIEVKRVYKEDGKDINEVMQEYIRNIVTLKTQAEEED